MERKGRIPGQRMYAWWIFRRWCFTPCRNTLQEHYISHYIRDYYVQIDGRDGDELEVIGIYAPVLENGERVPDIAKALENKYN